MESGEAADVEQAAKNGRVGDHVMTPTEQVIAAQAFLLGALSAFSIQDGVHALKVLRDYALKGAALE